MSEPKADDIELVQLQNAIDAAIARRKQPGNQIENLRKRLAKEEKLLELVSQHGEEGKDIAVVPMTTDDLVVVRRPMHAVYKRFAAAKEKTYEEMDRLVMSCLVYPDKEGFKNLLENVEPSLIVKAVNSVLWLAGHRAEELEGK